MAEVDTSAEAVARKVTALRRDWVGCEVQHAADLLEALSAQRDSALAELAKLRAENAWRPIESAPRDGTHFFGLVDGQRRIVAWGKTSHVPLYGFCLADQGVEDFDLCKPTRWHPFPPLPAEKTT